MALKILFFSKNYKKLPSGWELRPTPPSVIRLSYTGLLTMSSNLDILTFKRLLQTLPLQQNPIVACQTRPRLLIFHFAISLSRKKCLISKMFEDVIACDLGPLNEKSWLACDSTVH